MITRFTSNPVEINIISPSLKYKCKCCNISNIISLAVDAQLQSYLPNFKVLQFVCLLTETLNCNNKRRYVNLWKYVGLDWGGSIFQMFPLKVFFPLKFWKLRVKVLVRLNKNWVLLHCFSANHVRPIKKEIVKYRSPFFQQKYMRSIWFLMLV